jgi:hypothetical protein
MSLLDDLAWSKAGEENQWVLPEKAAWPLRLLLIRTVRYWWLRRKIQRQARDFASIGIGLGHMNPYDAWVLHAIACGKC